MTLCCASDAINEFVAVTFDPSTNSINCTFLNKQDTSNKLCRVIYGQCSQPTTQSTQGNVTDSMNSIILTLTLDDPKLCYIVTASNEDYTVEVEGSFRLG